MRKKHASDIGQGRFAEIARLLRSLRQRTKPATVALYEVFFGALYLRRTGCQWRSLPKEFAKWRKPDQHDVGELEQALKKQFGATQRLGSAHRTAWRSVAAGALTAAGSGPLGSGAAMGGWVPRLAFVRSGSKATTEDDLDMAFHCSRPRIHSWSTAWLAVACSLLFVLSPALAWSAETWDTLDFEVFEGQPWAVQGTAVDAAWQHAMRSDQPRRATVAMTPVLRKEIEDYLGQVARRMQAIGFGKPRLDGPVTRADGRKAFRVYYFDYGSTGRSGYARFETGGMLSRHLITLNASLLTQPGPQGPRLSTKAYVDLAHELFHAVQDGSELVSANTDLPLWMSEGQAEAIGHDIADDLGKVPRGFNPLPRWGLRPYFTRLAVSGGDASDAAREASYQSSSFGVTWPNGRLPRERCRAPVPQRGIMVTWSDSSANAGISPATVNSIGWIAL